MRMKVIDNIKLDLPDDIGKDFLTRIMGGRMIPKMEELLDKYRKSCLDIINPKGIYSIFEIKEIKGDEVYFDSGNIFKGPNISKILKGSEIAIIYIFTLGSGVDLLIRETNEVGDNIAVIIMDSITTNILEYLGIYIAGKIKKEGLRKRGWASTCSYSPGQYKWTIEEQKEIFSMLDGSKIGVQLNSSYIMVPFKTVSGVYGFGSEDKIDRTRIACDICPRKDCIGRR
jgi:hypothetical protein